MRAIKPKTAVIPPVRVTEAALAQIKRNAKLAKMTTAEWVRSQALVPPLTP